MDRTTALADAIEVAFGGWQARTPAGSLSAIRRRCRFRRDAAELPIVPRDGCAAVGAAHRSCGARAAPTDYHALVALNLVLGGQFVSRINIEPARAQGLHLRRAHQLRVQARPRARSSLHASVQSDATADAVREALASCRRYAASGR